MWKRKKRMKVGYIIFSSTLPIDELNDTTFTIVKSIGMISNQEKLMISGYPYGTCGVIGKISIIAKKSYMCDSNPLCMGDGFYCEGASKIKPKTAHKMGGVPNGVYKMNVYKKL